ncbi:Apple domain-containing protein [Aphelenchoides fujianensis]|nr:Apple domain-containing protein [Aphelenchoides fujianensis]
MVSSNFKQLKPCFERYDGFKIVNAVPFHSEWRMKAEEWCLEFCVRASSRCISIVYDKHSHICHYFNVNGIESEKIAKQPRMVYFQIAEKQCAEKMQNRIEQDDYWRNINYLRQQQQEANETAAAALPARSEEAKSPEEQQVSGEQRTTGAPVVTRIFH